MPNSKAVFGWVRKVREQSFRQKVGGIVFIGGIILILPYAFQYATLSWHQAQLHEIWAVQLRNSKISSGGDQTDTPEKPISPFHPPSSSQVSTTPDTSAASQSTPAIIQYPARIIGKLSIPKLGLDDVILEGTSLPILDFGPGHLIGSPYPGHVGNSIIAAHNDLEFHTLGELKIGDVINVETTEQKKLTFIVVKTAVIGEQDFIGFNAKKPMLTLSTCYPFNAYKTTPYRYIVTADLS